MRQIEADTPIQKIWFSPFIPTANGGLRMTLHEKLFALSRSNLFLKRDARQTRLVIDRYHREVRRFLLKENIDDLWKKHSTLDRSPNFESEYGIQGRSSRWQGSCHETFWKILHLESLHGIVAYRTFYINQGLLKTVFSSLSRKMRR